MLGPRQAGKTPKLYFYETGLVCHLLGIKTAEHLMRDPLRGNIFENMVVSERLKQIANAGKEPDLYFLRTAKGFEIDLLEKGDDGRTSVCEIKSAMSYHHSLLENLKEYIEKWAGDAKATLVYDGKGISSGDGIQCMNFREWNRVSKGSLV